MTEKMILIPGRTGKQGTTLNQGRLKPDYIAVTSTLEINRDDMQRLGLADGDPAPLSNETGETVARCLGKKPEDLPAGTAGTLFIACGPPSSALMASDTAGGGMPLSRHMEVEIEKVRGSRNG